MTKKTTRQKIDEHFQSFEFAKSLVRFLESTGRIKEKSTDEELERLWYEAKKN